MTTDDFISDNDLTYSFCNKKSSEVQKIIAVPGVFICNDCVDICKDVIDEEKNDKQLEEAISS
ncbi:MAG TPA: ClpX C4-type zinc finger protein, partial [Candidatus Megaira endosymbiont of Hartmannula sinica]|nr:ClpX C4-type zinc finger protein [Candidatus Megaera endosymbiont of Hartmannula sinica]